jgi:hypothetical protein
MGKSARGRITVGDFAEEFEADLTFWDGDDYRASWWTASNPAQRSTRMATASRSGAQT